MDPSRYSLTRNVDLNLQEKLEFKMNQSMRAQYHSESLTKRQDFKGSEENSAPDKINTQMNWESPVYSEEINNKQRSTKRVKHSDIDTIENVQNNHLTIPRQKKVILTR